MELYKMHYKDVKDYFDNGGNTVILPIGTMEAHGALPLGTDVIIPYNLALKIAKDINAIVAPPVYYAITKSLLPYPGSLTVSKEIFEEYILDIVHSLSADGFTRIILMNGHGGNITSLENIMPAIWSETGSYSMLVNWWLFTAHITEEVYKQKGGHAGIDETAAIMYYAPELVRKELYTEDMAEAYNSAIKTMPFPGSIILYKEGEGLPDFNEDNAKIYMEKVEKVLSDKIKHILKKWDDIE